MLNVDNATPQDIWSARLLVKMNGQDGIETPENIVEIARLPLPDIGTPEHPKSSRFRNEWVHGVGGVKRLMAKSRADRVKRHETSGKLSVGFEVEVRASDGTVSRVVESRSITPASGGRSSEEASRWLAEELETAGGQLTVEEVTALTSELGIDFSSTGMAAQVKSQTGRSNVGSSPFDRQLVALNEALAAELVTAVPQSVLQRAFELLRDREAALGPADVSLDEEDIPLFETGPIVPETSRQH